MSSPSARGSSSRSSPRGRRPSPATLPWRCIRRTRATRGFVGLHVWRPLVREQIPDRGRRRGGPGVRHRRAQDHPGARQGRFRDRPAPPAAGPRRAQRRRHAQRARRPGAGGPGPVRRPQEGRRTAQGRRRPREGGALREQRRLLRARRRADRAAPDDAVVAALSARRGGQGGGARRAHQVLSGALDEGLPALAREHPGLVHQPPALVGPPHSGVVSPGARPREAHRGRPPRSGEGACVARRPRRSGELGAGGGRARHLGLVLALAVRHDGLAGPGGDGAGRLRLLLSDRDARDRARHHLLLGGAHDHGGPRIHPARRAAGAAHPVPERLFHRHHPRPSRAARCRSRSAIRPIRST